MGPGTGRTIYRKHCCLVLNLQCLISIPHTYIPLRYLSETWCLLFCPLLLSAALCCFLLCKFMALRCSLLLSVALCFLLAVALVCSRLLSVGPRCSGWLSESLCYSHPLQLLNHLTSLNACPTCELDLHIKHITLVFKSPLVSDSVHDACTQHISSFLAAKRLCILFGKTLRIFSSVTLDMPNKRPLGRSPMIPRP